MRTDEALRYAQERDLDLVEVAPEARPPVCRVLDYSKYKYEQAQKLKAARKHQQQITIREIKFRPKIAEQRLRDQEGPRRALPASTRTRSRSRSCSAGARSRTPSAAQMILDRLAEELAELAIIEQRPNLDGRNMTMMLGPSKAVLAGTLGKDGEDGETAENGEAPAVATRRRGGGGARGRDQRRRPRGGRRRRSRGGRRRRSRGGRRRRSREPTTQRSRPKTTPSPRPSAARSVPQTSDRVLHRLGGAERP